MRWISSLLLVACIITLLTPDQADALRFFKIGDKQEVRMGKDVADSLEKEYGVEENANVAAIGKKLAGKADRSGIEYSFKVLKMKDPNAFACPGGYIYITKPLLKALKSDDEIASVLGHEIAHVAKRHSISEYEKAMSTAILINLGLMAVGANEDIETATSVAFRLMSNGRSQKDEYQADEYGIKYTAAAGYDPNAFVKALETLRTLSGGKELPKFLSTHPPMKDRIEKASSVIKSLEEEKAEQSEPPSPSPSP